MNTQEQSIDFNQLRAVAAPLSSEWHRRIAKREDRGTIDVACDDADLASGIVDGAPVRVGFYHLPADLYLNIILRGMRVPPGTFEAVVNQKSLDNPSQNVFLRYSPRPMTVR